MIESIAKLLEVFKSYVKDWKGLVLTLTCGLFLYLAYLYGTKYIENKFIEFSNEVVSSTEQIISEDKLTYQQKVLDGIQNNPLIDMRIHDILDNTNEEFGFNRNAILLYHDGTRTPTGNPFIKYTMRYERIREKKTKIESQSNFSKDQGSDAIAYFYVMVKEHGIFFVEDVENTKDGMLLYQYKELGIKSFICSPVLNRDDQIIGIIIHYSYDNYIPYSEDLIKSIEIESLQISSLIDIIYSSDKEHYIQSLDLNLNENNNEYGYDEY